MKYFNYYKKYIKKIIKNTLISLEIMFLFILVNIIFDYKKTG